MLNSIHDTFSEPPKGLIIDPTIIDSKRLQMFYACVKEGSFAGAAHLLSLSPSAISHSMKSLEEDLGCSLFRRFGPQVKPTGAAVRLLPMVEDLLVKMAFMKRELAALDGRSERLALRLPLALLGMFRVEALTAFHECFPAADFDISVREAGVTKPVDFEIDFMNRVPNEMVRRSLGDEVCHGYVAPFHRMGQNSRVSLAELKQCLLVFSDSEVFDILSRQIAEGSEWELSKWILPSPWLVKGMAQQGQGIAFLPDWALGTSVAEGSLVKLKLPGVEIRRTFCAWWEPNRPLTWAAEVFLSLFSEGADAGRASL
jgi:LysR family transcriptional regulator, low CO2-responsive transcriptional regulator